MGLKSRRFGFPFRFYGAHPFEFNADNPVYDIWFSDIAERERIEALLPGTWGWKGAFGRVELTGPANDELFARLQEVFRSIHAVAPIDQVWFLGAADDESEWSMWSFAESALRPSPPIEVAPVESSTPDVDAVMAKARSLLQHKTHGAPFWGEMLEALVPHFDRPDVKELIAECIGARHLWQRIGASALPSDWLASLADDGQLGAMIRRVLARRGYPPALEPMTLERAMAQAPALIGDHVHESYWTELREAMAPHCDRAEVRVVLEACMQAGHMLEQLSESAITSRWLDELAVGDDNRLRLQAVLIKRGYEPALVRALDRGENLFTLLEVGDERAAALAARELAECGKYSGTSNPALRAHALMPKVVQGLSAAAAWRVAQPWLESGERLETLFHAVTSNATVIDPRWLPVALEHADDGHEASKLALACPHPDRAALLRAFAADHLPLTWPLLEALLDDDDVIDRHVAHRPDGDIGRWLTGISRLANRVDLTTERATAMVGATTFAISRLDQLAEINGVGRLMRALIPHIDIDWAAPLQARADALGREIPAGWQGRQRRDLIRALDRLARHSESVESVARWFDAL